MLDRWVQGLVPEKHHTQLRDAAGALLVEECLTRDGFRGAYTILHHRHRPQALRAAPVEHGFDTPFADPPPLLRRHFRTQLAALRSGPAVDARTPLLCNDDLVLSLTAPTEPDPTWFSNGDGDDLHFIQAGSGTLRSVLGDLRYGPLDYLAVPKGVAHRFLPDEGVPQRWLTLECAHGLGLPAQVRNEVGQLRMDAPYCHRDFRRPLLRDPPREVAEAAPRTLHVKRGGRFHAFAADAPLDDCAGWDGTVYPFALPILRFQPRVGQVHLPPDTHATFAARGLLVCSFVPRPLDFHPAAVPCPYPHSSVDCDEVIFYVQGSFTSRRGVGPGSISLHPAGIPHGPQPGALEASLGRTHTDELAVMLDTARPLRATAAAAAIEDTSYDDGFSRLSPASPA